ncbi:hypothetical protein FXF52_35960, partial [Micromonospora sp. MP36]
RLPALQGREDVNAGYLRHTRFTELVGMPPSAYRRATGAAAGVPPRVAKQVTRPIRIHEASVAEPQLA